MAQAAPQQSDAVAAVAGATLLLDWISEEDEQALLAAVDAGEWDTTLRRRTQHFGHVYDYKSRAGGRPLGPLPQWAAALAARLAGEGFFAREPDQVIANEYEPGQGISKHVDSLEAFGAVIASLSLGSAAVMRLSRDGREPVDVPLPRRSLLVLAGEARTEWKHAIPARRSDPGSAGSSQVGRVQRDRRVSLTFRTMLAGDE